MFGLLEAAKKFDRVGIMNQFESFIFSTHELLRQFLPYLSEQKLIMEGDGIQFTLSRSEDIWRDSSYVSFFTCHSKTL